MLNPFQKSDAHLVGRALSGHREAFSRLVERHQKLVFAVAYGIVTNTADAEDVTQDAFLTAYHKLPSLREGAKFRSWLLTIARNRASDILVKRRKEAPLEIVEIAAPDTTDAVADAELHALLRDRIGRLPVEHREILLLHYYAGLKVREIADQLEISTEAAKKRLQRARDLLTQRMLVHLRDSVEEQGASAARTKTITGLIAAASVPWLGTSAAAAGTGLLSTAVLLKVAVGLILAAGTTTAFIRANQTPEVAPEIDSAAAPLEATAQAVPSIADVDPGPNPPISVPATPPRTESTDNTESPDTSGVLRGRIVSESGVPQANIVVTADRAVRNATEHHEVSSDESGEYAIHNLRTDTRYLLQAFGEHTFGATEAYARKDNEEQDTEGIVLLPATQLTGVITDTTGVALADIPVTPFQVPINGTPEFISPEWQELRRVRTDTAGHFTIPHAWLGDWTLIIDTPDYAILNTKKLNTSASPHTIQLERGATVHGRVVLPGTDEGVPHLELEMSGRTTTTDGDGNFTLRGVSRSDNNVQLRGAHNYLVTSPPFAVFPDHDTTGVRIEVALGGIIAGRVIDAETGEPIPQAWVELQNGHSVGITSQTATDEDGRYLITRIPPEMYTLSGMSVQGYMPVEHGALPPINVSYGSRRENVDVAFFHGISISGIVDFPEDASREDVFVNARYIREDGSAGNSRGSSFSRDGSFSVDGLKDVGKVSVQLSGPGWTSNEEGPFDLAQGDVSGIHLKAVPLASTGGSVSGQVVQGGGLPRPGETVWLDAMEGGNSQTTESDDQGAFQFAGVPPGSYRVFIPSYDVEIRGINVQRGQDAGGLILELGSGTGTISGRIVDWRGNPIAHTKVNASGSRNRVPNVVTDDDGRYTLSGIGSDPLTVSVYAPGFGGEQRMGVPANSRNVDFRLKPVGHVEGTVVDARTGQPITEFYIQTVQGASERSIEHALRSSRGNRQVSTEGTFRAINLAAEAQAIIARAPGYFANYTKVTVLPDEIAAGQVIRLEPSGAFTARITGMDGAPVDGAKVFINEIPHTFDSEHFNHEVARSDEGGLAPLDNLVPGMNTVYVYHPIHGRGVFEVNSAKQHGEIPFELPPAGRLAGSVLLNGEPVEGQVQISVEYPSSADTNWFSRYSVELAKGGTFQVEGLMPGTASLQLRGQHGVQIKRTVQIAPGETTETAIELGGGSCTVIVSVRLPEHGAVMQLVGTALVDTASGTFTIHARPNEVGDIEFQNAPAGHGDILVVGRTQAGATVGRHFSRALGEGEIIELTADFTQGISISGTGGNLEPNRESYALLITGEVDPALFSNEGYRSELVTRVTHQQVLTDTNVYQFDAIAPGTYTVVLALDGFAKTVSQIVEVADSNLRVDLVLP